jgi:hypothetical protein
VVVGGLITVSFFFSVGLGTLAELSAFLRAIVFEIGIPSSDELED